MAKTSASGIVQASTSQLVIIDMQAKLSLAMPPLALQSVVKNIQILLQSASHLALPVLLTEQYPKGLGATLAALTSDLSDVHAIPKMAFSACKEPKFGQKLNRDRSQIILTGMEAHICILQTALDLLSMGKQVFVVEDAIISRSADHHANAVARLRDSGCIITNTESVLFECLGSASHEAFKAIATLIK